MPDDWIRQWGDPTLHAIAAEVTQLDHVVCEQAERMKGCLAQAQGAALAATQVGILRRMFVYAPVQDGESEVLVNPEIVHASRDRATFLEGCLSYQSVVVAVERSTAVEVLGYRLDGREVRVQATGHVASLMQHEIDHLDGVITVDRADADERRRVVTELTLRARGVYADAQEILDLGMAA